MALFTRLANLIEIGSAIGGEENAEISKELEEAGNDPGRLEKKILLMLEKAIGEIEIEEEMKVLGKLKGTSNIVTEIQRNEDA